MSVPHELPALHLLNAVFAGVTGQDLYLAQQLKAGIEQALAETGAVAVAGASAAAITPAAFAAAVQALQRKFTGADAQPQHGFAHCDAAQNPAPADSLWTRQQVLDALKRLAPYPEATLLITNLHATFCPPGRRWTERRQAAYREVLDFLAALAVARKRERANLTLLFL
ncbi:MAG TPA: hypothetical protein VK178_16035 [Opitutaceae bacterium]|nr:hypothetical protein [Opitutaceae bacterium]